MMIRYDRFMRTRYVSLAVHEARCSNRLSSSSQVSYHSCYYCFYTIAVMSKALAEADLSPEVLPSLLS